MMPVTMKKFLGNVQTTSRDGAMMLRNKWLQECCDIVDSFRDEVEAWMPEDDPVRNYSNCYIYKCKGVAHLDLC